MAERLTEFVTKNCSKPFYRFNENSHISVRYRYCANIDKAINKLGKLEDIMERLGINFVEDLEDEIKSLRVDKYVYKKDRDTWKKACKEACDVLRDINYKIYNEDRIDFENSFYQQAKKEEKNDV